MELNQCKHCGGVAEFKINQDMVKAQCKVCGISTPEKGVSIDYAAKDEVAKLWNASTGDWPEWVQPTGAHDAYPIDAKVAHKGSHWSSTVAANVWEPGVSGWRKVQ